MKTGMCRTTRTCSSVPLNNANQLRQVEGFIERLPAHARVVAGGKRVGDKGYFYAPTVVSGLNQDDEIVQKEVFGPVITVQSFTDEDQAVAYANGVEYALASSVWTKDHSRAMRMSRKLDYAACGSTRTSRWSRRCRTAASRSPATARTSRRTASTTTRGSST
ncbi:hypothetical protein GCM10023238_03830 [Streptomyces heliomycini]